MIPFGPWRPDAEAINAPVCVVAQNCLPSVQGFRPLKSPQVGQATRETGGTLNGRCVGAVNVIREDGSSKSYAGTATKLYQLATDGAWDDASRTVGGNYAVPTGDQWRFDVFGNNLIAVNINDAPQRIDIVSGANFAALGGSPPQARYIAVVRDFVVLGSLFNNQRRIHWSSIGNSAEWTPGLNSGDIQDFPSGGPVRGLIGGETGYVFQDDKINRMIFVPGSDEVFQFDEVEGGRGLKAPGSLVKLGNQAFYFGGDGFYRFDLGAGSSTPIGAGKWRQWVLNDMRAGMEIEIRGSVDPINTVIVWAYVSRQNATTTPDRVLLYDWTLDEATVANISVEALSQWLSQGVTLDTMNSFGSLDELPYSLDSSFWKGGTPLLALFGTDHKLAYLQGKVMAAEWITADGQAEQRTKIKATRPHIDATDVTVAVTMRERDGDTWLWPNQEVMEDTGEVPAWASGNLARARIRTPAGSNWTFAKGIKTILGAAGRR